MQFQNYESLLSIQEDLSSYSTEYLENIYAELDSEIKQDSWDTYSEYNIVDTELVKLIDAKRSLIELAYSIAFDAGVNVNDVYSTVPVWDSLAHQHLRAEGKVVEPVRHRRPDRTIVGGYVKEPVPGMYGWTVSFDLTSLYPWIDIMYNISPETFVGKYHEVFTVDDVLNGFWDDPVRQQYLKDNNVTVAANGCMFTREKRGFIPAIMKRLFDNRKIFKDKMLDFKRALKSSTMCPVPTKQLEDELALVEKELRERGLIQ